MQVKYLGTYLDYKLNWKAHINYLCQKLNKILCGFKLKKKNVVPKQYKSQLIYYAIIIILRSVMGLKLMAQLQNQI